MGWFAFEVANDGDSELSVGPYDTDVAAGIPPGDVEFSAKEPNRAGKKRVSDDSYRTVPDAVKERDGKESAAIEFRPT